MTKPIRGVKATTGKPRFAPAEPAPAAVASPVPPRVTPEGMPGHWHWKRVERSVGPAAMQLMVGAWPVGHVSRDLLVNRESEAKYAVRIRLPGLKELQGHLPTEADAQAKLVRAVSHWFTRLDTPAAELKSEQ